MEEGTSPPNPGSGVPENQNSWQNPGNINPEKDFPDQAPVISRESVKPHPVDPQVYRTQQSMHIGGEDGAEIKKPRFPIKKIILSLLGIFLTLTVVVVVIAMFSSFRGSTTPISNEVTLTYWGLFEDEAVIKPILAEFEAANPNIKIIYEKQELLDYREKLVVRSQNGNGPDVFRFHNTWYPMLTEILLPLPKEVIEKSEFEKRYYPVANDDLIQNGTIIGIPLYSDTLALYINNSLLNQTATESAPSPRAPQTWLEFTNTAKAMTKRDERGAIDVAGAGIGTYENVNHAPDIISLIMAQNGVDPYDPQSESDRFAGALEYYTNYALDAENVWDTTQDNTLAAFAQGKLGMYFGYSWDYFEIKAQNPNIDIQIAPVPQLVRDKPVNIASYFAEGANSYTKHPKETLLFMEFLSKPETQEKIFQETVKTREYGEPYSVVTFLEKLQGTKAYVFADQSKNAISTPYIAGLLDNGLNTKVNENLKSIINKLLTTSGENQTALEEFYQNSSGTLDTILPE